MSYNNNDELYSILIGLIVALGIFGGIILIDKFYPFCNESEIEGAITDKRTESQIYVQYNPILKMSQTMVRLDYQIQILGEWHSIDKDVYNVLAVGDIVKIDCRGKVERIE